MPALVKSSFTEALLVVLECTDAVIHSKVSGRKSACIAFRSSTLSLTCQHDFSGWFVNEIGESVLATGCAGSGFYSSTFPTCIEANQQLPHQNKT